MTRPRLAAIRFAILTSLLATLAVLSTGCTGREHIRDDYGEHVRLFQSKQRVYAQTTSGDDSTGGLDSEEASVIHKSYRNSMGGKAAAAASGSNRVLMLGDGPNEGSK